MTENKTVKIWLIQSFLHKIKNIKCQIDLFFTMVFNLFMIKQMNKKCLIKNLLI